MIDNFNNKDLLKKMFQSSAEGILVVNEDYTILMVNPACEKLFNYTSKDLLNKNIKILIPNNFETQTAVFGIKKDGTEFTLDIRLNTTDINGKKATLIFLHDATKRNENIKKNKKINNQLAESDRKFDTLINNLQGIVYRCKSNSDWTMEYISEGCLPITGYSPKEFLNDTINFSRLTFKEDREHVINSTKKGIDEKRPFTLNFRIKDKAGNIKYLQELGRAIFDKKGNFEALEGFVTDITSQKETEIQLRTSEAKTKALLKTIPDLMLVHDKNGKILDFHTSKPTLLYAPSEVLIGKNVSEVLTADVSKRIKKALLQAKQSKKMVIDQITMLKNNTQIIYECRFMPFNSNKIFTIVRDITKKGIAEQTLIENEAKMKALLEAIPDMMFIQDRKGNYLDWYANNPENLYLPPEKFMGVNMKEVLPPDLYKKIKSSHNKVIASGKIQLLEYSVQTEKGIIHFEARVVLMSDHSLLTIVRDITEKKATDVLLNIRNNALASANNSIVIADTQQPNTPIIYCNNAFEKMTGYSKEEALGRNCNFLQNDDRNQQEIEIMKNAVLKGKPCNVLLRNYKKDGTMFWNNVSLTPINNEENKLTHFIGVQNDVTTKVQEEDLKDKTKKILELIAKDKSLKIIGEKIIETVETHLKDCIASILVLDKQHKTLHKLVAPNLPKTFSNYIEGTAIGPKVGSCGTASFLKKEVIVANIANNVLWEDYREIALKNNLKSSWAFPILSSTNQVLGTFAIYSKFPRKPLPNEKELLLDMTYLASIAIEKHNNNLALQASKKKLEKYTQKLEERVQERTEEVMATVQKLVESNLNLEDQILITKQAESDAITSKSIAAEVAKIFPNGFVTVVNKDLSILFAEGEALEQLGIKQFIISGTNLEAITIFSEDRKALIKDYITKTLNGQHLSFDVNYKNRYFAVNTAPMYDDKNEINSALLVYTDISIRKEIEFTTQNALKKEKELNELKSRFVSMASHEFRTPLSAILTSAILIGKQNEQGKELKREKYVAQIEKNVNNLVVILNDFLSLSKLEEGKVVVMPERFDLISFSNILLNETKIGLKKGQKINIINSDQKLYLYLDTKLLRHIFNNLLSNASKYSPENSTIDFKITHHKKKVIIQITDQGMGIPDKEQQHLFNRFFRAKNAANFEGTGLGLNIAKNYTELMGGTIGFKSNVNEGTTFWVEFSIE